MIMFPGSSRWTEKSSMWLRPTEKSGSFWKLRISPNGAGGITGAVTAVLTGKGMTPSWPTRNDDSAGFGEAGFGLQGVVPGAGEPLTLQAGATTVSVCVKPTPSIGMITLPTVLIRSYAIPYPPRTTVFRWPNVRPRTPPLKLGFQASATRGAQSP